MRRRVFTLVPALAVPVLGGVLFACESESNPSGPDFDFPEAGLTDDNRPVDPTRDATVEDSPVDASPEASTAVTINVTNPGGAAAANIRVVFHDAAGAVLETKVTGADGKAVATTANTPAMVSVLLHEGMYYEIVTYTGIEPGDTLDVTNLVSNQGGGPYNVSLPNLFNGANSYTAAVGDCQYFGEPWIGTAPLELYARPGCLQAQNAVLATARDNGNVPIAFGFAKNVASPAAPNAVAVTTGAWSAPLDVTLTTSNLETGISSAVILETVGRVGYRHDPTFYGEDGSATFKVANGFADGLQAYVTANPNDSASEVAFVRRVSAPAAAGAFAFDFATALPLVVDAERVIGANPRRFDVSWVTAAPLTTADGGVVTIAFFTGQSAYFNWTFVVPPNATTVKAPAMPTEAEAWLPRAESTGEDFGLPRVLFVDADQIPNYKTFRQLRGKAVNGVSPDELVLPANGTVKATSYFVNPR